jgi:hypothetical protein
MDINDALEPMLEDAEPRARLSKRMAEAEPSDSDGVQPLRQDKRRRKVSSRLALPAPLHDVGMDVDDVATPLLPFPRAHGKKRNRAEAGSTMGDDDVRELALDNGDDDGDGDESHMRHRRRRLRKSLGAKRAQDQRGQKRERERGSDETSEDEDVAARLAGKTARRRQDDGPADDSDVAMSDRGSVVSAATTKGRRVGEVWEAHGFKHKIGPDGRRLTMALVRADRPLYNMVCAAMLRLRTMRSCARSRKIPRTLTAT